MKNLPQMPDIPEEEQTPLVKALLGIIEQYSTRIVLLEETVAGLKDEIIFSKGRKNAQPSKPSGMDNSTDKKTNGTGKANRDGSKKKSKNAQLTIHEDVSIQIPPGTRFKGYCDFIVQDLIISSHNTRYRLERWITPQGNGESGASQ